MILRQTQEKPVCGYWDGGSKSVFNWTIDGDVKKDEEGYYVRIGSWEANY